MPPAFSGASNKVSVPLHRSFYLLFTIPPVSSHLTKVENRIVQRMQEKAAAKNESAAGLVRAVMGMNKRHNEWKEFYSRMLESGINSNTGRQLPYNQKFLESRIGCCLSEAKSVLEGAIARNSGASDLTVSSDSTSLKVKGQRFFAELWTSFGKPGSGGVITLNYAEYRSGVKTERHMVFSEVNLFTILDGLVTYSLYCKNSKH